MSDAIYQQMISFFPFVLITIAVSALLWVAHWLLIAKHGVIENERLFTRQLIMLGLTLVAVLTVVLNLPINESSRNQLIGLFGLLLSGVFAFSSTTAVANLFAGLVLRFNKPFGIGDFIRVGEHFGRVVERGLFDTEIQSERRNLIAIPNTYLITHPIATTQRSGAIVSVSLSLGYDIHHLQVEKLLVDAAKKSGLEDPFVHILELGDYSVTYQISGVLEDIKGLITARSELFRFVLDMLHDHDIEIVSPTFMTQRRIPEDQRIIPSPAPRSSSDRNLNAEEIMFDKAERADLLEEEKNALHMAIKELEVQLKDSDGEIRGNIQKAIEGNNNRLKVLETRASKLVDDESNVPPDSAG
jgi:small-conductance mechanosensitive channel